VVAVELSTKGGHLIAQAHTHEVYRFLTRNLAAVPAGTESNHLDLDGLVADLLADPPA